MSIESLTDDKGRLEHMASFIERVRKHVAAACDRAPLASRASDELESLALDLENRAARLRLAAAEIQDEINALPSESAADLKWHQARVA